MTIDHSTVKAAGNKLFAVADWNAAHTIAVDTIFPNIISGDDKHHYFGTDKDVDMYFQSATSFFRIVNGSNYFLLPRLTSPEIKSVMNVNMILGDNAGARYFAILNSTPAFVFKCDSLGRITLPHQFTNNIQFNAGDVSITLGQQHDYSTHVLLPRIIPTHAENISGVGQTTWYIEIPNTRAGMFHALQNVWLNYVVLAGGFSWSLDYIDVTTGAIVAINAGVWPGAPGAIDLLAGAGAIPIAPNLKLAVTITTVAGLDAIDIFGLRTNWLT